MKLKYPAEAFALGMILFSAGMKEAFAAGILVILAVVFAEFLKNLLEPFVPDWSLKACVLTGTAAVTASAFHWGFTVLGIAVDIPLWLMTAVIGLFAALPVLTVDLEADYGGILWESAIVWAAWIVLAMVREIACTGSIFGNVFVKTAFQSKFFGQATFGFITAALFKIHLVYRNCIFKVFAVMQLVVVCDKHGMYIRKAVDELHAPVKSQREAGRAQCVTVYGLI